MIQHWVAEKFTDHQYFGIGGFGLIETYVSDPLGIVAPIFKGSLSNLDVTRGTTKAVDYSGSFTDATSYSISPAVESGWSFNTSTGVLTIVGAVEDNLGPYTVTGTNVGGSANSNEFYITIRAASVGGSYGGIRTIRSIEEYEKEIELILAKERAEALNKQKALKKKEVRIEAKLLLDDQQNRQIDETRLELLKVSESLLTVEKDLIEITKKRAEINLKARIMRDDDEVIMLLMSEGYL